MNAKEEFEPVDVAVIGAGVAGLSAAMYCRMVGLSTRVFERHSIPGGLCTSWKRKGYVFDYCVEWFMGCKERQAFYRLWKDLGLIGAVEFGHIESFGRYVGEDGRAFDLFTDPDRLEEETRSFPAGDQRMLRSFCAAVRKAGSFCMDGFSMAPRNLPYLLRSLPSMPTLMAWSGKSARDWCAGFSDPLLREGFPALVGPEVTIAGPVIAFAAMAADEACFLVGGSLSIALAMEARAKALGADFAYRAGVRRIIVEGGRAIGLELEDGRIQRARHVVAAGDVHSLLSELLQGRTEEPAYRAMFEKREIHQGIVQVSLGVEMDPAWGLPTLPKKINLPLSRPITVDGREWRRIGIFQYAQDRSMADEGRAPIVIRLEADYDHWVSLRRQPAEYKAEKARILAETIQALEGAFPGLGSRVEASDVSTPTTCERYTANWRGSTQGWIMTAEQMRKFMLGLRLPKRLRGIRGLRLAGQWTEPGGGIPPSAKSGKEAALAIAREEGRRMVSRD